MTDTKPKIPTLSAVESTNVSHVGHDGKNLFIRFKSGGLYSYDDVPAKVHEGFVKSESPGGYFRSHVAGKYPHTKIDA